MSKELDLLLQESPFVKVNQNLRLLDTLLGEQRVLVQEDEIDDVLAKHLNAEDKAELEKEKAEIKGLAGNEEALVSEVIEEFIELALALNALAETLKTGHPEKYKTIKGVRTKIINAGKSIEQLLS